MTDKRQNIRRRRPTIVMVTSSLAIVASLMSAVMKPPTLILWNASASVPIGLYAVQPAILPKPGELAVADLPQGARQLAAERAYLPTGVPLIKPVIAAHRAEICRVGRGIYVQGLWVGDAQDADERGRRLPVWSGCLRLTSRQILLMNPKVPDSFDGRYFGPVDTSLIRGRAIPVLTFHPSLNH